MTNITTKQTTIVRLPDMPNDIHRNVRQYIIDQEEKGRSGLTIPGAIYELLHKATENLK